MTRLVLRRPLPGATLAGAAATVPATGLRLAPAPAEAACATVDDGTATPLGFVI